MNVSTFIHKPDDMQKSFCMSSERGSFLKRALLLSALLLPGFTPAWAYDFEVDGLCYNITSDTEVEVTYESYFTTENYASLSDEVTIPASVEYDGGTYAVTAIGGYAFGYCAAMTSVNIPESVTAIEKCAFSFCTALTEVTIPNSVTSIGDASFLGCLSLTGIEVGENNQIYCSADGVLFSEDMTELISYPGGKEIDSFEFPESATRIGRYAFSGGSMVSMTIPEGITSIGYEAFYLCLSLKSVTLPNSLTTLEEGAFDACMSLETITIPESVTKIEGYVFSMCSSLTSCTLPSNMTEIPESLFWDCPKLTSITIPKSVTKIGERAFEESKLTEIYSLNPTPPTVLAYAFQSVNTGTCVLYVPEGSYDAYATAEVWSEFLNIVEVDFGGIDEITSDNADATEVARYDLSGRQLLSPQSGVNIVRYSDGTVEKILVK